MEPIFVFVLLVAAIGGVYIVKNRARVRSEALRFGLELLDAALFGYAGYVGVNLLLNFSAFRSWDDTFRVLFFLPPMPSVQLLAILAGFATAYSRYQQGPGMDYKDRRETIAGRTVWCHRAALLVANALLAKRTDEENAVLQMTGKARISRPQHLLPFEHYDEPEPRELEKIVRLEDAETNPALTPYVSNPDEYSTVCWGGIRLPIEETRKHCLVVGGTGSGKTLLIHALMKSILPKIATEGDFRAFVYDDKLDFLPFARQLGIGSVVWNLDPFSEDGLAWDIAADVDSQEAARQVASALAPVDKNQSQKYFDYAALQLIAAAIIALREKCGTAWTLRDLILVCIDRDLLQKLFEGSNDVMVSKAMTNLLSPRVSTDDVMSTVIQKLTPYAPVASLWSQAKKKVGIRAWHQSNAIILTTMRQGCAVALKPINQALFRLVASILVDDTRNDRQSWIFLDEVREIGKLDGLSALTNKGRDKGVRVVMGFQTIEGMRAEWGDTSAADEAANICSNRIFLHSDSALTREWMASHVGEVEVDETTFTTNHSVSSNGYSLGKSWSTHRQVRKAMLASDFDQNLKPATPEFGVTALNMIPLIGTYVSWLPWSWVLQNLPRPDVAPEKMRDSASQDLRKWDAADLSRLKLGKDFILEGTEGRDAKSPVAQESQTTTQAKSSKSERLWNSRIDR